mgnify:CR=1 FL=1
MTMKGMCIGGFLNGAVVNPTRSPVSFSCSDGETFQQVYHWDDPYWRAEGLSDAEFQRERDALIAAMARPASKEPSISVPYDLLCRIVEIARECAEDLTSEIDAKYPSRNEQPVQMRRHARDLDVVARLTAAIDRLPDTVTDPQSPYRRAPQESLRILAEAK